jgi:hypothetical protein
VAHTAKTDGIQTASFASSAAAAGAIPYTELSVGERRGGRAGLSEGAMPWVCGRSTPPLATRRLRCRLQACRARPLTASAAWPSPPRAWPPCARPASRAWWCRAAQARSPTFR